jgi:hypothetical protein
LMLPMISIFFSNCTLVPLTFHLKCCAYLFIAHLPSCSIRARIFFFFLIDRDLMSGLQALPKQVLYCLSHASSPFFAVVILEKRVSRTIYAWAVLQPPSSWSQPPK